MLIKKQTLIFKKGQLVSIIGGRKDYWYNADYIFSDFLPADLNDPASVRAIRVPNFSGVGDYGATGMLDYVLRMKAGLCFDNKQTALCSALLWKSTELMFANKGSAWGRKDFERLITWHLQMKMPEEAQKGREYLKRHGIVFTEPVKTEKIITLHTEPEYIAYEKKCVEDRKRSAIAGANSWAATFRENAFRSAKDYGRDLVVFHDHATGCCAECAQHIGRVYSISGKNTVFPALPEYAKKHGNFHPGCHCTMAVYFDGGCVYRHGQTVDPIQASQRPMVDDRTEQEKQWYQESVDRIETEAIEEASKEWDRVEYQKLLELYPEDCPKSFGAYRRMKSGNTAGFKKLLELANK